MQYDGSRESVSLNGRTKEAWCLKYVRICGHPRTVDNGKSNVQCKLCGSEAIGLQIAIMLLINL